MHKMLSQFYVTGNRVVSPCLAVGRKVHRIATITEAWGYHGFTLNGDPGKNVGLYNKWKILRTCNKSIFCGVNIQRK